MVLRLASTTILVPLFLLSIASAQAGSQSGHVSVQPDDVRIGIFYSGQTVRVKVLTSACEGIVMRVTGPDEPLVLKKKGKKYGFLWMNVGEVHYKAVPTLYLLRSSSKLQEMATPEELNRLKLGFDALKNHVPAGSKDGAKELFGELVKLKQKDHLFSCEATGLEVHPDGTGWQEATGEFTLPAKTPVGNYTVDVFCFQASKGELIGTAPIHLQRTSTVSFITSLAANHGLLYGCLAVVMAVLTGLLTGFIFRK
jgi:uncharacterized protein (TIGR02186 family)